jgi:hypothetical protein
MLDQLISPKNKLTLGSKTFECELISAKITALECGFDQATIILDETDLYPSVVKANTVVKLEVTSEGVAYPTNPLFAGICNFPLIDIDGESDKKTLTLNCLGTGFGLSEMDVATEYGTQSSNPSIATINSIVSDMTTNYVNKILGGVSSGYTYTNTITTTDINSNLPFISFPYKPAGNSFNDLVDAQTALNDGAAGPHWIVTTDNKIRFKQIGVNQTGWTKYYSGATNTDNKSTLTYGEDYTKINSEPMETEGNYIIYYGIWRRPSNGDLWTNPANDTEAQSTWLAVNDGITSSAVTADTTNKVVDTSSVRLTTTSNFVFAEMRYPHSLDAAWNFAGFTDLNTPNLNFYIIKHGYTSTVDGPEVRLYTDTSNYFKINVASLVAGSNDVPYHASIPIGYFYGTKATGTAAWTPVGSPDWANINYIGFIGLAPPINSYVCIDGLHFGDAPIVRVAWNSDLPGGFAKMRLITDNTGKDDSLSAADDSGLMACFAHAELLRMQKDTQNLIVKTPMFPTALPGQFWNIQYVDFRASKLIHEIKDDDYYTTLFVTDDLTNGRSRARYEDQNKVWSLLRPEWQDKQASSIKAGNVDYRITRLVKDYA